jgi:hypothetical protein
MKLENVTRKRNPKQKLESVGGKSNRKIEVRNVCVEFILRKQKENKKQNPKMETGKVNGYVACSS